MSHKTAKRQRFYAQQRAIRANRWWWVIHPDDSADWMLALMGDANRMIEEACGVPLLRGEVGRLDGGLSPDSADAFAYAAAAMTSTRSVSQPLTHGLLDLVARALEFLPRMPKPDPFEVTREQWERLK